MERTTVPRPGSENVLQPINRVYTRAIDDGVPTVVIPSSRDGRFVDRVAFGDTALVRNGSGLCEWGILRIDIYRAALYVERKPASLAAALAADQVMVIHLEFARGLTRAQLQEAYTASVRANAGSDAPDYEAALGQLVGSLDAVREGESYSFISDPQRGLLVQRDGEIVTRIDDERFRQLFVRLYLGDKPPTEDLRQALLGGVR